MRVTLTTTSQATASRVLVETFIGSPHYVEHGEDDHPEQVHGVPVGRTRLDLAKRTRRRTRQLADEDAERHEADDQVDGVDARQKIEVLHEVATGEGVPVTNQVHPFGD